MWDTFSRQAETLGRRLINSVESYPWLWIALAVVTLVLLIRRSADRPF